MGGVNGATCAPAVTELKLGATTPACGMWRVRSPIPTHIDQTPTHGRIAPTPRPRTALVLEHPGAVRVSTDLHLSPLGHKPRSRSGDLCDDGVPWRTGPAVNKAHAGFVALDVQPNGSSVQLRFQFS